VKKHFAAWRPGIDVLREAGERYTALFEPVDDLNQISQTPLESVELPDDERVALASKIDRRFQINTRTLRARSES
jgi:hypothetical protein